jgi:hypothetical protein
MRNSKNSMKGKLMSPLKVSKDSKETFLNRRLTIGQQGYEKYRTSLSIREMKN